MDIKLEEWKLDIERVWLADTPDWSEAARLVAVISRTSGEVMLRQAATQALPILRHAVTEGADSNVTEAAHRRLGLVRAVLHELNTPKFGKREALLQPQGPQERHRQLLGLPSGRRLSAPEIHRAFKRAAKTAHPDAGGSAPEFLALSAAREALIKER